MFHNHIDRTELKFSENKKISTMQVAVVASLVCVSMAFMQSVWEWILISIYEFAQSTPNYNSIVWILLKQNEIFLFLHKLLDLGVF